MLSGGQYGYKRKSKQRKDYLACDWTMCSGEVRDITMGNSLQKITFKKVDLLSEQTSMKRARSLRFATAQEKKYSRACVDNRRSTPLM